MPDAQRIAKITLDEKTVVRRSADIEHERAVAIFDLLEENSFAPVGGYAGPFHLDLAIEDNRLILDIRGTDDVSRERIALSLAPFRGRSRRNNRHPTRNRRPLACTARARRTRMLTDSISWPAK